MIYHNGPMYLDRQIWANSVGTAQTAPEGEQSGQGPRAVWSGSTLFAILSASFAHIILLDTLLLNKTTVQILG